MGQPFFKKRPRDLITSLHFFVLTQKNEAKKVKTAPALPEKLALKQLNRPCLSEERASLDDF